MNFVDPDLESETQIRGQQNEEQNVLVLFRVVDPDWLNKDPDPHFCSIRIRIQAKTELSRTISFSNFFEFKIGVKSNKKYRIGVIHLNFFQQVP
jgi:hypothetical protein